MSTFKISLTNVQEACGDLVFLRPLGKEVETVWTGGRRGQKAIAKKYKVLCGDGDEMEVWTPLAAPDFNLPYGAKLHLANPSLEYFIHEHGTRQDGVTQLDTRLLCDGIEVAK